MRSMQNMWNSSNPALTNDKAFQQMYGSIEAEQTSRPATATVQGVVNKTAILMLIAVVAGMGGFTLVQSVPSIMWISAIAAFILVLGAGFLLAGKPQLSPIVAPIFAIVEGVFLGSLTSALEQMLASRGIVTQGLALQAMVITVGLTVAMLGLYSARIIRPTKKFQAIMGVLIAGIMVTYLLMFVLSMFGTSLPFISLSSAFQGGMTAWIGLGLNAFILIIASLTLIMDFKLVEDRVAAGSPKYMEWYCGFALLVTIAWIYYEAVKLAFRLQVLLRD